MVISPYFLLISIFSPNVTYGEFHLWSGSAPKVPLSERAPSTGRSRSGCFRTRRDRSAEIVRSWQKPKAAMSLPFFRLCAHTYYQAGWSWKLGGPKVHNRKSPRRPRLTRTGQVAPKRRDHLPLVEWETAPWWGLSLLSRGVSLLIQILQCNSPLLSKWGC